MSGKKRITFPRLLEGILETQELYSLSLTSGSAAVTLHSSLHKKYKEFALSFREKLANSEKVLVTM